MTGPPGWIPPEFREIVYADSLDEDDLAAIMATVKIIDDDGMRSITREEAIARGTRRIIGVKDARDGSYHPNQYFKA